MIDIWTEKYRPQTLDEVVNHTPIVSRLKAWVEKKAIPHMLFAGPAGVGKTTIALCLAKELFGNSWREHFLELNASDERGIQVVRENIKNFARMKTVSGTIKIVFLDESDALTPEAQQALRRTMEKFSSSTRFILNCNYSSRLIDPIQSRTAVFRFKRLAEEDVTAYLKRIVAGEKITADDDALKAIFDVAGGDMRKATNLLQSAAASGNVTQEQVYEIASQARPQDIKDMLSLAVSGNFPDARKKLYALLIQQGLSGEDVIKGIHRMLFELDIPEKRKLQFLDATGETEFRLNMGGSEELQLEALLARFMRE